MRPYLQLVNPVILMASLGAMFITTVPTQAHAQEHQYSSQLMQRYTSGCSDQLSKKGYSAEQAQALCACSLKQMQKQHSQSSAIVVLTSAQLNPIKDPKLGLPSTLSKYFTPCFS